MTNSAESGCSNGDGGGGSDRVRLFGVRLADGSFMKKSASTGNLSHYQFNCSSNTASPINNNNNNINHNNNNSKLSKSLSSGNLHDYLSDDPNHASCSSNRRSERKKGEFWTKEEHRLFLASLQKYALVPNHPFQVMNLDTPKGAFEEKQIGANYYVRIDMPGVQKSGLTITRDTEKNQIRICGKVPTIEEWPKCVRAYASVINFKRNLDEIEFEHTLVNGSLKFIFHETEGHLQILKYKGGKVVNQSSQDHLIFGNLESTSSRNGVSTLGEITLTQRNCEINPFMIGFTRSCVAKKWVSDGRSANDLHILVDTPGMEDFKFDIGTKACIIRGALAEENGDDILLTERSYFISMKFDCACCIFDRKATKKRHQVLKDGLLRLQLRVTSKFM